MGKPALKFSTGREQDGQQKSKVETRAAEASSSTPKRNLALKWNQVSELLFNFFAHAQRTMENCVKIMIGRQF